MRPNGVHYRPYDAIASELDVYYESRNGIKPRKGDVGIVLGWTSLHQELPGNVIIALRLDRLDPRGGDVVLMQMDAIEIVPVGAITGTGPQKTKEQQMRDWLLSLDEGKGHLLRYFSVIRREFDCDFDQLAAARLTVPMDRRVVLGQIDPIFWQVVEPTTLGHKFILAQAIIQFACMK